MMQAGTIATHWLGELHAMCTATLDENKRLISELQGILNSTSPLNLPKRHNLEKYIGELEAQEARIDSTVSSFFESFGHFERLQRDLHASQGALGTATADLGTKTQQLDAVVLLVGKLVAELGEAQRRKRGADVSLIEAKCSLRSKDDIESLRAAVAPDSSTAESITLATKQRELESVSMQLSAVEKERAEVEMLMSAKRSCEAPLRQIAHPHREANAPPSPEATAIRFAATNAEVSEQLLVVQSDLEAKRAAYKELTAQLMAKRNGEAKLRADRERLYSELASFQTRLLDRRTDDSTLASLNEAIEDLGPLLDKKRQRLKTFAEEIDVLHTQECTLREQIGTLERDQQRLMSRLERNKIREKPVEVLTTAPWLLAQANAATNLAVVQDSRTALLERMAQLDAKVAPLEKQRTALSSEIQALKNERSTRKAAAMALEDASQRETKVRLAEIAVTEAEAAVCDAERRLAKAQSDEEMLRMQIQGCRTAQARNEALCKEFCDAIETVQPVLLKCFNDACKAKVHVDGVMARIRAKASIRSDTAEEYEVPRW